MKMLKNIFGSILGLSMLTAMGACDKTEIYLGGADAGVLESPA